MPTKLLATDQNLAAHILKDIKEAAYSKLTTKKGGKARHRTVTVSMQFVVKFDQGETKRKKAPICCICRRDKDTGIVICKGSCCT